MKYVKTLSAAAIAAAALMAFAGTSTASASVLCKTKVNASGSCPAGWGYSGEIHAATEERPTLTGVVNVECQESTFKGSITEGTGSPTETPNGAVTVLTFGPANTCTCAVTVVNPGTLEIHVASDTGNGTVTSNGTTLTITCSTIFGNVHCNYVTQHTNVGTLTGSTTTGSTATIDIAAELPQEETSSLCSKSYVWHSRYKVTTPDTLDVATVTGI